MAVVEAACGRTITHSTGPLPGHARGGGRCARTPAKPCATSPAFAAPSSPQHDSPGVTAAAPDLPPHDLQRHLRRAPELTNSSRSQRQRSFSMPTSGMPAHSALGGTSNALLAALAARLAQRVGRVAADGSVTLAVPVNERSADDTRANAITMLDITVDPAPAATDLREIRAAIKQALIRHREVPDERQALLPLVPLLPQRLARRMVGMATGGATNVVVASNIGAAPPAVKRPDGTDADYAAVRFLYPRVTKAMIDQIGGLLCLHSARADRQVFVSVLAYQPGRRNSNDDLQQRHFERSERILAHRLHRLAKLCASGRGPDRRSASNDNR